MASVMRRLVSKKKKRFEWGGFDLDLSYITDRIIGIYYPHIPLLSSSFICSFILFLSYGIPL